jgi:hypothetical protein
MQANKASTVPGLSAILDELGCKKRLSFRFALTLYPAPHVVEVVVRNHLYAGIAHKQGDSWLAGSRVQGLPVLDLDPRLRRPERSRV